eukprot:GHRQ01032088.1.p2 GENE.GHRQ01032088.1~~GHRQ01032088.1.p2  ORF type:complete len:186 (+),score=79.69 GHRQ01032088.1:1707-2264(+)
MHANANIAFQLQETRRLLDAVLSIQPRTSGGSGSTASSSDTVVATLCAETLSALPPDLDVSEAAAALFERMPDGKLNSLSVVLGQEVERFQRLAAVLRQSLVTLQAAIRGQVVMSAELEAAYNALLLNQVGEEGRLACKQPSRCSGVLQIIVQGGQPVCRQLVCATAAGSGNPQQLGPDISDVLP